MTLKARLRALNNYGKMTILIGLLVLVPVVVIPFYPSEAQFFASFAVSSIVAISIGILICVFVSETEYTPFFELNVKRSIGIVLYSWLMSFIIGALPFVLGKQLSPLKALFEAVSAYTTTGLTVINFETLPHIYFFHRSFMQFCGIFGFTIMMILVVHDKHSMSLFNAEGHPDKLAPSLRKTAKFLFTMYTVLLIISVLGFLLLKMPLFDAICHSMSSLATGGFSTKANNFMYYSNPAIIIWDEIIMIVGSINAVVILTLYRRKFTKAFKVSEFRLLLILLLGFTIINTWAYISDGNLQFGESLLKGSYNVVTSLSTAGNSIDNYAAIPPIILGSSILLMMLGGSVGSTSGGIKLARVLIVLKVLWANIKKRMTSSRTINTVSYTSPNGRVEISEGMINDAISYITLYLLFIIVGTLALCFTENCTLEAALFEFTSCLSGVGLSCGLTTPATKASTLVIEMIGMAIGRLEIFIVLIGIHYAFNTVKKVFTKTNEV